MADNSFYLKVISSDGIFFSGKVVNLMIPAIDGQRGIQAHHENMVIAVTDGTMKFQETPGGPWQTAVVGRGGCWIANNRVQVIAETAERPEDIDIRRAEEAKERAKEQLRQKQSIEEYYHSQAALSRAMARLKAAAGKSREV